MKRKILRRYTGGEVYDKETNQNYPVVETYWEQNDGTFSGKAGKIFVDEVEVPDKEEQPKRENIRI